MNKELLKRIIEAALMASEKPLTIDKLLALFTEEEKPSKEEMNLALSTLEGELADRGVQLKEVSSGYRLQVNPDVAPWIARLWEEKPQRYSRAMLETLALVAYRQPITRGEIEEIRGVSVSSHIMRTLMEREWVRIVGHRDVPGKPALYATTRDFLDYFGLAKLDELPSLAEIRDIDKINEELDLGELSEALEQAANGSEQGQMELAGDAAAVDGEKPQYIEQYDDNGEPIELKLDEEGRPMELDELDELQAVIDRVQAVEQAIDEDIHSALGSLRDKQDADVEPELTHEPESEQEQGPESSDITEQTDDNESQTNQTQES